jgi:uncharacterized membrane protein YgaE (UPF0421/DUF939 family)
MKATNKFKEPIIAKEQKSSYKAATDALIGTSIVFAIATLLLSISKEIALAFILYCIVYVLMLLRFTQQQNN